MVSHGDFKLAAFSDGGAENKVCAPGLGPKIDVDPSGLLNQLSVVPELEDGPEFLGVLDGRVAEPAGADDDAAGGIVEAHRGTVKLLDNGTPDARLRVLALDDQSFIGRPGDHVSTQIRRPTRNLGLVPETVEQGGDRLFEGESTHLREAKDERFS
jgi:hypothetical protein